MIGDELTLTGAPGPYLAVDWGTTNRRVFRIGARGEVEETERDERGITSIEPGGFSAEAVCIRARHGDLPMICAGMVGSNRGWIDVPYVECPAGIAALATRLHWIDDRTAIVPGLVHRAGGRADVMRGEEVQILGAVAAGLVPRTSLLAQPGTHCKWARVEEGRIASFATAMTGEVFALLRDHSLLSSQLTGRAGLGAAFSAGVVDAAKPNLLVRLFGVRADMVSGQEAIADYASYVSGLLIGSDIAGQVTPGTTAHILADPSLGKLYASATEQVGGHAILVDSHAAFVSGINLIWKSAHDPR